jgi:hypothetical protein
MRMLIFGGVGLIIGHKESMDYVLIHTSRLYHKPTNPDKSRPCITHRHLQLILSDWILLNVVDSEVFRITANACYYFPRCRTAASTEASDITAECKS